MSFFARMFCPKRDRTESIGLLSQADLDLAVRKERSRCDRYGFSFSLVSLELRSRGKQYDDHLALMAGLLNQRLRLTDERGLMPEGRLGLMLPHTDRDGALVVLNDVVELASKNGIYCSADVTTYPSSDDRQDSSENRDHQDMNSDAGNSGVGEELPVGGDEAMHFGAVRGVATIASQATYPLWKRAMDIGGALAGLVLAAPVIAAAGVAIKWNSRGPVFYKQYRTGHHGRKFVMFKLRTMIVNADQEKSRLCDLNERDGPAFKMQNDPRVTKVGRFLRAAAIDELPQLWNVLIGDMALVGPRPLPCHEAEACQPWQWRRHESKPGLTCTWQIAKSRKISFDDWMRMDLRYGVRPHFFGDFRLILSTAIAMVLGRVEH